MVKAIAGPDGLNLPGNYISASGSSNGQNADPLMLFVFKLLQKENESKQ